MSDLWQFSTSQRRRLYENNTSVLGGSHGAPMIVPAGGDSQSSKSTIDIVSDFAWTVTPKTGRVDVPYVRLVEYYIESNPLLNQIANNLAIASEAAADLKVDELIKAVTSDNVENENKKTSGEAGGISGFFNSLISESQLNPGDTGKNNPLSNILEEVTKTAGGVIDHSKKIAKQSLALGSESPGDSLNPYKLLYSLQPTQFEYMLPYFNDSQRSVTNSFSDSPGDNQPFGVSDINQFINKPGEAIAGLTSMRNIMEPGMYIEKPQYYSAYNDNKQQYNVQFPLSNTGEWDDVIKNWQFVYLLVYQNTQNRVSRTLVAPPVIYEASIPGVWYSPYATISNLTVNFIGARRTMMMNIPGANKRHEVVIPDTYDISLTITDLHSQSQNFLHNIISQGNIISAS